MPDCKDGHKSVTRDMREAVGHIVGINLNEIR